MWRTGFLVVAGSGEISNIDLLRDLPGRVVAGILLLSLRLRECHFGMLYLMKDMAKVFDFLNEQ